MSLRKALTIAQANVVRLLRDRQGLFFIFVFPLMLILVLGLSFGGGFAPRVGVLAGEEGPMAAELVERLGNEPAGWRVVRHQSEADVRDAVRSGTLSAGLILPNDYDAQLRSDGSATVTFVVPPGDLAASLRSTLDAVIGEQAAVVRAARFTAAEAGLSLEDALESAEQARSAMPGVEVAVTTVGESPFPPGLVGFGLGAQSQLVLFMFVTSMSGAAQLILSRMLGVSARMLSTPTTISTIVLGEALGRLGVAMLQGVFIVLATALAFGVSWGDPLAASAIVIAFAAVGAGAAMLLGAVASNAEQAAGVGVFAGLGIAALGGAMAPPEIFPPIMDTISHATPHRWAIDALRELAAGGGIADTLTQLGVLGAFAVVLGGLATWRLRAALTGAG